MEYTVVAHPLKPNTNTCGSYNIFWYSREFPNPHRTTTFTEVWRLTLVGVVFKKEGRGGSAIGGGRNAAVRFSEYDVGMHNTEYVIMQTWGTG